MPTEVRVHFLPQLTSAEDLQGREIVVVDVLRATTTIACALSAGAARVIPCQEVDEARKRAEQLRSSEAASGGVLLGGERHGVKIEGFDLGNSPAEYTSERVAGKTIVFSTTNGTRAMRVGCRASRVWLGSFVNLSRVCAALRESLEVDIVCAGTEGRVSREDTLLAGALVDYLRSDENTLAAVIDDSARIAAECWRAAVGHPPDPIRLTEALRTSTGGRNLAQLDLEADIRFAARVDACPVLPCLDPRTGEIGL